MTVGTALAAARSAAGLSVETVASRTNLRRTLVAAIERDDFSLCMGDVYARGHIRNLARVVGADPEALVAQYNAECAAPSAEGLLPGEGVDLVGGLGGRSRSLTWSALLVVSLVLVLGYGGFSLLRPHSRIQHPQTVLGAPASATAPAASSATPRPHAAAGAAGRPSPKPAPQRTGVSVSLAASTAASWVRATNAGGTTLFEGIVAKGRTQQFTDRTAVKIVVGNAGAVSLTVNGKHVPPLGALGTVATKQFGPADPA